MENECHATMENVCSGCSDRRSGTERTGVTSLEMAKKAGRTNRWCVTVSLVWLTARVPSITLPFVHSLLSADRLKVMLKYESVFAK